MRTTAAEFGRTMRVVSVGVGAVPGNWLPKLESPENDAKEIARSLKEPDGCAVPGEFVDPPLIGMFATRKAVHDRLKAAIDHSGPGDTVLFYFAGHGVQTEDDFYLCTSEADPSDLGNTAISGTDFGGLIDAANCRGVLAVLDCCNSAAVVEHAPSAFTKLRTGEFRILLSSARAGQKSWETADGKGTVFGRTLVEILNGAIVVGQGEGAVYFSDLIQGLETGIAEKRSELPDLPPQEMVFSGSYISDPLVLVMRGQTLDAVRFATARYSPRQLRRMVRASAVSIVGALCFVLITWYGLIDATQYVVEEGGHLIAYRGHPRFSLPGYPKPLWRFSYGSERLDGGASKLPIIAPLGKPVMPLVEAHFDRLQLAAQSADEGDWSGARASTMGIFNDRNTPFQTRFGARLLFTEVAVVDDVPLLKRWTHDDRSEIRLAALRALFRLSPKVGATVALLDVGGLGTGFSHVDILRRLDLPCTREIETYLKALAGAKASIPVSLILDASVRSGCRLDNETITKMAARLQWSDASALAGFIEWRDKVKPRADQLDADAPKPADASDWRWILLQAYLPNAPCDPAWADVLIHPQPLALVPGVLATARHCPGSQLVIKWNNIPKFIELTLLQDGKPPQQFKDIFGNRGVDLVAFLPLIAVVVRPDLRDLDAAAALTIDARLRTAFLELLVAWGDKTEFFGDFLDANDLDLRRAYVEHERLVDDTVIGKLVARIGRSDIFYTSLLGRIPLPAATKEQVTTMLKGTAEARASAACVLAMQASTADVVSLLTSVEADIRSEAADCVPYNASIAAILAALPQKHDQFSIEGLSLIKEQARLKAAFISQLAAIPPELRTWRLQLADVTPGLFGLWGRGMRDWFAEQQYQSRLASGIVNQ
ncbi:caspase family protein [Rhizobium ruizarguesonis]|uniref:caspase family protein n=1 Tax=Rhizobium ruizarguesonis TaxID=2081791 RepID=UPI001CF1A504|nr:caspase family protein [Rhizobium ruizarguesonis]MCB2399347.1 caspase family protein [Rhizobium ruizarguesonis]